MTNGLSFGVMARVAGYSNKVAALTGVIIGLNNLIKSYITNKIENAPMPSFLTEDKASAVKLGLHYVSLSAISFGAGRTLRALFAHSNSR